MAANKYAQCKTNKDFYELMYGEIYPNPLVKKGEKADEARQKKADEARQKKKKADDIWQDILGQYKSLLEEQEYIEIGIDEQGEIYIKTGQRGRPVKLKREKVKEQKLSIRVDEETNKKIKAYSEQHGISVSDTIRVAIDKLYEDQKPEVKPLVKLRPLKKQ